MALSKICKSGDVEKYKLYISNNSENNINYNRTFINAFDNLHLNLMKEIYKSNNVKVETVVKIFYQMLTNNNIDICEWIKTLNLDINELSIRLIYYKLCEINDITSIKWLCENYSFDTGNNDVALNICAEKKYNELAKWIIDRPKYISGNILRTCCVHNNIELFEDSIKKNKYYLRNNKLCEENMHCVLSCIEKNNINMVLHIYSISIIDDSIYLEHFVNACKYSRIELYEYILKNKYDVIKQKMRNLNISHFSKDTLLHLIKNHILLFDEHIEQLFTICYKKSLWESIDIINLNFEDNKRLVEDAFYNCCYCYDRRDGPFSINREINNAYMEYAKKLLDRYPLLDITHQNDRVFEIACENNSITMCGWLMTKVNYYNYKRINYSKIVPNYKIRIRRIDDEIFTEDCCVCYETSNGKLQCNHYVCFNCLIKLRKKTCPQCIRPIIYCNVTSKKRKREDDHIN